jgi:hypothetical protein
MFSFVGITVSRAAWARDFHQQRTKEASMAIRDAMRASAAQFVEPGENIEQVLGAQTTSPITAPLIGALIALIINRYRIVAVTDRRILVLDAGKWTPRTARAVVSELPRATRLGPTSGLWAKIETPAGKIYVRRYYFKDVKAADNVIAPDLG